MSLNDPLANSLSSILNSEKSAKSIVNVRPVSKMLKKILEILKNNNYIGEYKVVEDGRGDFIEINLLGKINKCGVIKPRFSFKKEGFEKHEKRFLPAKDFGILIVSTNKGLVTHKEAKKQAIGGKLIAYCY